MANMIIDELRVGNLMQYHGVIGTVIIGLGHYDVITKNGYIDATSCEPIKLTSEVLQKCKLEERYAKGEWSWNMGGKWQHDTEIREREDGYHYLGNPYPPIVYLHQLQNIYFYLTREELDVSELIY